MTKKAYDWKNRAPYEDHTRKKHKVYRQYLSEYLSIRCQNPHQSRFRLVLVEAFAGGGRYACGSPGSPLIFVGELCNSTNEINVQRARQGHKPVLIECLLLLNDDDVEAIELLKKNLAPLLAKVKDDAPLLNIEVEYSSEKFEHLYSPLVERIQRARCRNVMFILDQCGYNGVSGQIIADIMTRWRSAEVFLTFAVQTLLSFLTSRNDFGGLAFDPALRERMRVLSADSVGLLAKQEWMGSAEQIVHAYFRSCAPFVSPFSINNPGGWRYWLMHFANSHRARQVYNDLLHKDSTIQAHFGRSGLRMLSYDPTDECRLYLFDEDSRESARDALGHEIPSLLAENGDAMVMSDFYESAYSETPAHTDDIHDMIIENPELEVITEAGGSRRSPRTIRQSDTLRLKSQRSMYFMFDGEKLSDEE